MTFKNTSNSLNHIARVASASTRPRANGRIDLIPENAREPEEYYNTIRDQYVAMNARFKSIHQRLTELKAKLRATLPYDQFRLLSAERDMLATQYTEMQPKLVKLRSMVRASGKDAWATTFYAIAERVLGNETFKKMEREVEAILGRLITEVPRGEAEWSEEKRASKQRGDRRNQMRRLRRNRIEAEERVASKDAS